jgi:hypothetical protein
MFTNKHDVPLPLAVWLASGSDYDFVADEKSISATSLLAPLRSIVLSKRVYEQGDIDITDLIASKLGTSVHTAAEVAWKTDLINSLLNLGYPEHVAHNVRINPSIPHEIPEAIDVYIEKRSEREIDGFKISGKFDFVIDGELHDIKTTKTFTYIKGSNNVRYAQQGSIYRWLNPDIVTGDHVHINYFFTNWSQYEAVPGDKEYPPKPILVKKLPLMSLYETEEFIRERVKQIKQLIDVDQDQLPECTPKEIWMEPSRWAYYKNPDKTKRATKVFDLHQDAMIRNSEDGGKGLIVERKSEPKFCYYCKAKGICTQAEQYIFEGILKA